MANNREQEQKDENKKVGSGVGAVPGDTIATALDPFGSAAGAISGGEQESKELEGSAVKDNYESKRKE